MHANHKQKGNSQIKMDWRNSQVHPQWTLFPLITLVLVFLHCNLGLHLSSSLKCNEEYQIPLHKKNYSVCQQFKSSVIHTTAGMSKLEYKSDTFHFEFWAEPRKITSQRKKWTNYKSVRRSYMDQMRISQSFLGWCQGLSQVLYSCQNTKMRGVEE